MLVGCFRGYSGCNVPDYTDYIAVSGAGADRVGEWGLAGLRGDGGEGRAVGWSGPEPPVCRVGTGRLDKGDDPHGPVAAGTHQRVHLVDLLRPRGHPCPRSGSG